VLYDLSSSYFEGRQRTRASLEVAGGEVVEHEAAGLKAQAIEDTLEFGWSSGEALSHSAADLAENTDSVNTVRDVFERAVGLALLDQGTYAEARTTLKAKFGKTLNLRELDADVHRYRQEFEQQRRSTSDISHYRSTEEGILWIKPGKHGKELVPLTNFQAKITSEVIQDDDVEERRIFEIDCRLGGQRFLIEVPASGFASLNWVIDNLYALDAETGQELWRYETGGVVYSSPAVSEGTVYVGSKDNNLYALE